ncbi:MAG: N-acetyltransferase [Clostridia bacterium]|nr:N-acetyltransferase [Clostridia bacterium]
MSITIKEVLSKKDLWEWIEFPNTLYRGNEYYVPFLANDEFETFSSDKNPAYDFCETKLFSAYKDNKPVGRIAGLINHAYNKKWNKNAIRFTRFDFIDDFEVSQKLFDAVVAWGKERGHTEIMGPIGFTDMDHEGMLVEGFDEFNMSITFYNHPYYLTHMERLGLRKDIDWIEYKISVPAQLDPRIERISEHYLKKGNYKVVTYTDRKVLYKEAFEAFKIIDIAFSKLYGTVPLTPEVIKNVVDGYIPLVNLDYICSVKDTDGNIIGFGVMVPSIAKALKKSGGKLFPFGILRMLKALKGKNDTLEMYFVAVEPEYQLRGVPAIMISTLLRKLIENKVKYCETGPMLETNTAVHSMWKPFDKKQHKRRRCFIKEI